MNCHIEVKRTDKCIACSHSFLEQDMATMVRIQDDMGYSLALMCDSCMGEYRQHKERQSFLGML
jgi:hypothetical protein